MRLKSYEEFKNAVNGIQYDMENDQLYVHNKDIEAVIDNPFKAVTTYREGLSLEEKAEADEDVWKSLYRDYKEEA